MTKIVASQTKPPNPKENHQDIPLSLMTPHFLLTLCQLKTEHHRRGVVTTFIGLVGDAWQGRRYLDYGKDLKNHNIHFVLSK